MSEETLAVVGAGAWGSVLAWLLGQDGRPVRLWMRSKDRARHWREERVDPAGRSIVTLPASVVPTASLEGALEGAAGLFVAVPNAALDATVQRIAAAAQPETTCVSCSKGLFAPELHGPSRRIASAVPQAQVAVLSGPNLAAEIAAGRPAAATVAASDAGVAQRVQGWANSDRFRVYRSDDPVGTEVAGAYKNVIALAAGMSDALNLGENAKAALITRGLAEMVRLGQHLGGRTRTFYGLAGVGDLIATCATDASRNHRAGARMAKGASAESLLAQGWTAEGLGTVKAVASYADRHDLRLPIAAQVAAVAFEGRPADVALDVLLASDPRAEWEAGSR